MREAFSVREFLDFTRKSGEIISENTEIISHSKYKKYHFNVINSTSKKKCQLSMNIV